MEKRIEGKLLWNLTKEMRSEMEKQNNKNSENKNNKRTQIQAKTHQNQSSISRHP